MKTDPINAENLVVTKKLRKSGNTFSLTLDRAVREASGFQSGQDLQIEAARGRVVITAAEDETYRDAMDAYDESAIRYRSVYDALAK